MGDSITTTAAATTPAEATTTRPAATPPAATTPAGRHDHWSDAILIVLLALTPGQLAAADVVWRHHAPRSFAGLLTLDGFTWDADRQAYIRPNGRPVADESVTHALLLFLAAIAWDLEHHAEQAARGEVTVDHWRDTVAPLIRSAYIAAYVLGVGGLDALTDDGRSTIGTRLADSMARLDRFAGLVADRDPAVDTIAAVVARAALYVSPGYTLHEAARAESHETAGFAEERSILEPGAEHCLECAQVADLGWVAIGSTPLPGGRECGPGCRCRMEYRRDADANADE